MVLKAIIVAAASLAMPAGSAASPAAACPAASAPAATVTSPPLPAAEFARPGPDSDAKASNYDAYLRAARAFWQLREDVKAVDAYRQAIVAAPDEEARSAARAELEGITHMSKHFYRSLRELIRSVMDWPIWTPAIAIAILLPAIWLVGLARVRLSDQDRIAVWSSGTELSGAYLKLAILAVVYDFEKQRSLAASITKNSAASAVPTLRTPGPASRLSVQSLRAMSLEQGWTRLLWMLPANVFHHASATFKVEVQLLSVEKNLGINVLLRSRGAVCECWRHAVAADQLAETVADIAYNLVVFIWARREGSR